MDISSLDKNFIQYSAENVSFCLCDIPQWMLEGFPWQKENRQAFVRLPERIFPELSERKELIALSKQSGGGVLRFRTDSKALLLKGVYREVAVMPHMPLSGSAGFDIMLLENGKEHLLTNFKPDALCMLNQQNEFAYSCELPSGMHEYKIYFPLYAGIEKLQLGFTQNAKIETPTAHKTALPILFYGSSITQGGCASRPSNCHCALTAKSIDAEQINLGFSGNAKGELCIAREIAKLSLSCFVMDYDHNAPTVEDLAQTHEPFFQTIREKQPDLPIVFVTRPYFEPGQNYAEVCERREIVLSTYTNALKQGDKRVYFADGMRFFDSIKSDCAFVDIFHPNDLGFYFMAEKIIPIVKEAIQQQ